MQEEITAPEYEQRVAFAKTHFSQRDATEIRATSVTGGQKGTKLAKFSLIPAQFLWALAEHFGKGAKKYDPWNWLKGYEWSLCMDALERHYNAWKMGESYDEETGSHHLVAVAWHCCALFIFELQKLGTDDRGKV